MSSPTPKTLISGISPALTPETQAYVLGNLPEHVLVEMIKAQAKLQRADWLRTMVDGGVLDFDPKDLAAIASEQDLNRLIAEWSDRSIAMTGFMSNTTFKVLSDELAVCTYQADDVLKSVLAMGADRILQAREQLINVPTYGSDVETSGLVWDAVGRWIAAACVADMPDLVAKLSQACPGALSSTIPLSWVGDGMYEYVMGAEAPLQEAGEKAQERMEVTPLFIALQLSRIACMDAILEADLAKTGAMGHVYRSGDYYPFTIFETQGAFPPVCEPSAYAHLVSRLIDPTQGGLRGTRAEAEGHARSCLYPQHHAMRPYIPELVKLGLFQDQPSASFYAAAAYGHPEVLETFRGTEPWDGLTASPFAAATELAKNGDGVAYEEGLLKLMELAIAADRTDVIGRLMETKSEAWFAPDGTEHSLSYVEPISSLAEEGFHETLIKFLDIGVDPRAVLGSNSLLDWADRRQPEVANLMRSWLARNMIHDLAGSSASNEAGARP